MKLQDFYAQLNVDVSLRPVQETNIEQVAYMTQHTADFHLTALQRSTSELGNLLATKVLVGWVIEVQDRFGDYGMAGAILSTVEKETMRLDTFLLGCHVLGKQVEYITLKQLAQIARQYGCAKIQICYRATPRNGLSKTFITTVGGHYVQPEQDGLCAILPLETIEALDLTADSTSDVRQGNLIVRQSPAPVFVHARWQKVSTHSRSDIQTEIAKNFQTARQIHTILLKKKHQHQPVPKYSLVAPQTPIEQTIASIWQAYLGVSNVGLYDNFFALGGHSLLATQVISRVRDAFAVELPLRNIFEAPTIKELAGRVETMRREAQGLQMLPIMPTPRDRDLPLSFAQQRLWFLNQLQPGSTAYNMPAAIQLKGFVNVIALEQAFNEIVRRHEALRTNFVAVDAEPLQVITLTRDIALPIVDLRQLPATRRESVSRQLAIDEAQRPFDLAHDPLLRTILLRIDTYEHLLLLTMHHIISDGWSIGILIRELGDLYNAFAAGDPSPLPVLPIQYADYAIWQQTWLRGEIYNRQLDYWKRQLVNAPSVLELPTDYQRPTTQRFRGTNSGFQLSLEQTSSLKNLSQQEGVTLFITLLAIFNVLLHRYTTKDHIVVGTPIANRSLPELEKLIGFFANTLVLHTNLNGNPSFREVLRRVREVALGAYDHQDLPFEKIVADLQVERRLDYNPLFQVLFVLQNVPISSPLLGNLILKPLDIQRNTAILDLALSMEDTSQGLQGRLEYNTDLFNANTIHLMILHFQTLISGILENLETPIAQLPLMTAAERQQVLTSSEAEAHKRQKLSAQVKSLFKSKEGRV